MRKPITQFPCRQFRLCLCISTSAVFTFYFLIMDRARRDIGTLEEYQNLSVNAKPKTPNNQTIRHGTTKLVLLWSPLFSGWNFLQDGKNSFRNCPESRCEITSDRNRLEESDVVLFHVRSMSLTDLPLIRRPRQKWTFFSLEAPPYSHFHGFSFMSNMFNWTMTYRSDSDVVIRYGRILKTADRPSEIGSNNSLVHGSDLYSEWMNKTRMAVWMVSHCLTSGNREGFVDRLRELVDVTTFGECGLAVCQFNKTTECLENFSKKFHFYLSFENAICDDYVTEKFYRVVKAHMIPVVFGGGAYSSIAPPHSYINALDFESVEALSAHLHRVASDFSLFSSYFEWRRDGYDIEDTPNHCELCAKLHSHSFLEASSYEDMTEWWIEKSHCRRWKDRPITS